MECINCPYAEDDIEKLSIIYDEDDIEYLYNYIFCNKVGGKILRYGTCSIVLNNVNDTQYIKRKRNIKEKRIKRLNNTKKHKNRVYNLYNIYKESYTPVAIKVDDGNNTYYKRIYRGKNSKRIKRMSHKAVRRYRKGLSKGNNSNKVFSYWNELY